MYPMHLSLSKPARRNLKAIGREFDRCSHAYPALFHQRMIPWSENGPAGITLPQWDAFRSEASSLLDAEEWWEWDEPSSDGDYLGLWFGDGEGLDEFANLSDAVAMVLSHERLSFDPLDFNFEVHRGTDWICRLQEWGFKHQMPLLRSDMTLWGCRTYDLEDFYELAEQWDTLNDGMSVPRKPVVWRLIDNVFTSSAAAIRAILWPDTVIATNEPWPLCREVVLFASKHCELPQQTIERSSLLSGDSHSLKLPAEQQPVNQKCDGDSQLESQASPSSLGSREDSSSGSHRHRLIGDELFWSIKCADSGTLFRFRAAIGFKYLAMFISAPNVRFTPMEAYTAHGTQAKASGEAAVFCGEAERAEATQHLPNRNAFSSNDVILDEEADRNINEEYQRLLHEIERCNDPEDEAKVRKKKLADLKKNYVWTHDRKGKSRLFPKADWEKPRKAVTNAINRSLEAIRDKSKELANQLDSQLDREKGFCFRPNPKLPEWEVIPCGTEES